MSYSELPPGWSVEPVSALASSNDYSCIGGPFGSSLTRKDYVDYEGVPVSRGSNLIIGSRLFVDDDFVYVSAEKAKKLEKNSAYPGDIILTQRGTIGQVAIIPKNSRYDRYILSQNQMKITVDQTKLDPYYFLYYFLSQEVQNKIQRISIGGVIPGFNLTQFREFEVVVPPKEEQQRIVRILSGLDNKIELNRQINQTLEHIAQAIFKSWFVDFEPVKAKIQAKQNGRARQDGERSGSQRKTPKVSSDATWPGAQAGAGAEGDPERAAMCAISGKTGAELDAFLEASTSEQRQQLTATAALFPDEQEDSDLGLVPKGWVPGTLDDICYLNANSRTKKSSPDEVWYVDLTNTKNGVIEEIQHYLWSDAPSRARRVAKPGDTIVGTVRPGNRSFALIGDTGTQLTASTGFAVLSPKTNDYREYIYIAATSNSNVDRLAHLADGAAYPAVRPDVVTQAECFIPTEPIIQRFSELADPLFQLREENLMQSEVLAACRNSLLPKLLSGKITLGEAQSTAEAVA